LGPASGAHAIARSYEPQACAPYSPTRTSGCVLWRPARIRRERLVGHAWTVPGQASLPRKPDGGSTGIRAVSLRGDRFSSAEPHSRNGRVPSQRLEWMPPGKLLPGRLFLYAGSVVRSRTWNCCSAQPD
jgi:hypothetical protein